MCWADKLAVVWGGLLIAILVMASPEDRTGAFQAFFSAKGIGFLFVFVGLPWIVLRGVDWIGGGPYRRRLRNL